MANSSKEHITRLRLRGPWPPRNARILPIYETEEYDILLQLLYQKLKQSSDPFPFRKVVVCKLKGHKLHVNSYAELSEDHVLVRVYCMECDFHFYVPIPVEEFDNLEDIVII